MIKYKVFSTPAGWIKLIEDQGFLVKLELLNDREEGGQESILLEETEKQLSAYFRGERKSFDLPLKFHGTDFQEKVWKVLQTIPYGQTRSYKQVAEAIGNEKASRAVGGANNKNPLPILVPCHRVVGSNGAMVGYGLGLPVKKQLLALEGIEL